MRWHLLVARWLPQFLPNNRPLIGSVASVALP
jgi:hypothetical protein